MFDGTIPWFSLKSVVRRSFVRLHVPTLVQSCHNRVTNAFGPLGGTQGDPRGSFLLRGVALIN